MKLDFLKKNLSISTGNFVSKDKRWSLMVFNNKAFKNIEISRRSNRYVGDHIHHIFCLNELKPDRYTKKRLCKYEKLQK